MNTLTVNNFARNAEYAETHIQHILKFYRRKYGQAVYLNDNRCSMEIQKMFHIDMVIDISGKSYTVEVKTVPLREPPIKPTLYLEHLSCAIPGRETPGWIVTSKADILTYAFMLLDGSSDTYIISMPKLKRYFEANKSRWGPPHRGKERNQSSGYKVLASHVLEAIPGTQRYRIETDGTYERLR